MLWMILIRLFIMYCKFICSVYGFFGVELFFGFLKGFSVCWVVVLIVFVEIVGWLFSVCM